jgi:hypothetical protein
MHRNINLCKNHSKITSIASNSIDINLFLLRIISLSSDYDAVHFGGDLGCEEDENIWNGSPKLAQIWVGNSPREHACERPELFLPQASPRPASSSLWALLQASGSLTASEVATVILVAKLVTHCLRKRLPTPEARSASGFLLLPTDAKPSFVTSTALLQIK